MQTDLEKLDAIRSRIRVSYQEAKEALDLAGGDVIAAVIDLEKRSGDLASIGLELLDDIQKLLDDGNPRKIQFKLGGKLIKDYPVASGATAVVAIGLIAILFNKMTVHIEREKEISEGP